MGREENRRRNKIKGRREEQRKEKDGKEREREGREEGGGKKGMEERRGKEGKGNKGGKERRGKGEDKDSKHYPMYKVACIRTIRGSDNQQGCHRVSVGKAECS